MKQAVIILIICATVAIMLPLSASAAFSLVPCGRSDQRGTVHENCTLQHLIILIIRVINYLISMAGMIAIYFVLNAGFGMVFALGNAEKIQTNKEAIRDAVVGMAIVFLAFVFINLLVNGIFGTSSAGRKWWDPKCLYDITLNNADCPALLFSGGDRSGDIIDRDDLPGLAGEILGQSNITLSTDADCRGTNHAQGVINALAASQPPPVCSPSCLAESPACPAGGGSGNVTVNPQILVSLLDLSQTRSLTITSLTTGIHSAGSDHYSGEAVDIQPDGSAADWIAVRDSLNARGGEAFCETPSGGNDPTCVSADHIHWTLPFGAGGGGGVGGSCTGAVCTNSNVDICAPIMPPDNCNVTAVNGWSAQITAGVGSNTEICSGVDSVKMLKAIMANESDGVPGLVSFDGTSLGLFQIQEDNARTFKTQCGLPTALNTDAEYRAWLLDGANAQGQACIAAALLRTLVTPCGCDPRQLAAGYNGDRSCEPSINCGPAGQGGSCTVCGGDQGTRPTKRWECLWDNNEHTDCNANRGVADSFSQTRVYAPAVEACYGRF